MKRKEFIRYTTWAVTGILFTPAILSAGSLLKETRIRGKVKSRGKGVKNVVVSDGYTVTSTDSKGRYEMALHPAAASIFVSVPAGYAFPHKDGIAGHYIPVSALSGKKSADFELEPLELDDKNHQFVIWADPQIKNKKDIEKLMTQSVPDLQQWVGEQGPAALLHGITVGDIVWDELQLFADYNKAVGQTGIPFFQCLGNHDMDYKGDDEASDNSFQAAYGPSWYSFNRGLAHYIVLDDVRYLGKDREYDGYISQTQLDWLKKDLSFVPDDRLIILCLHIPVYNSVKNNSDLYAILGNRNVHIMSGHTHYNVNVIKDNIYEHNHGTVCGAWWTGPICGDGTPCGYGIYTVEGNALSWQYKSTGFPASHQMKSYVSPAENGEKEILVNIWNTDPAWKTELFIDGILNGPLEQIEGFDPLAYETLLGPELPKPRGFAEPKKTNHLFKARIPAAGKEITIKATDRFGKIYQLTQSA